MHNWNNRVSRFAVADEAAQRLGAFLVSAERGPIRNINRYWLTRRLTLDFVLEPGAVTVLNDSNLVSRASARDLAWARTMPTLPKWALAVGYAVLARLRQAIGRAERALSLARLRQDLDLVARAQRTPMLPFGTWDGRLQTEPLRSLLASWPERTLLMLHAADAIQHFAPARRPWRVLEIGSGPAILAGLMAGAFGSRHVLVDLPEQIGVGFAFLSEFFSTKRVLLPHEASAASWDGYDFVFLTPEQGGGP